MPATSPLVIALMGPTASGKTNLAIALHQQLGAEIISVDSAMVYRGLNIGAAKPSHAELALAPHRLIDIRDPAEPYSAADFCADAEREIQAILAQGKTPLLAGGTMLYFKALLEGLSDMPESDPKIRAAIEAEAQQKGWPALHKELTSIDPELAVQLHPNHSHRIGRALEVYRLSGKTMSEFRQQTRPGLLDKYRWLQIAIAPRQRQVLHDRIARRFEQMLDQGMIEEVQALHRRGDLTTELPAIRAVGYRQVWQYLNGELNFDKMKANAIAATRQLAKRQLTWLRGWPELCWLYTEDEQGNSLDHPQIVTKALSFLPKTSI